jgi:hypothetical protein
MHECYRDLSEKGMRDRVRYATNAPEAPIEWSARLHRLVELAVHPTLLFRSGVTPELLAYCGITLEKLVLPRSNMPPKDSHYALEHVIAGLRLGWSDLLLLGFGLRHLRDKAHFPLLVLYETCGFRAEHLFAFHMSVRDFEECFVVVDTRYAQLLGLNLKYWRAALEQH